MALYICTAGTSIAGGPLRSGEDAAALRDRIEAKLLGDRTGSRNTDEFLIRASAETNGLVRSRAGRQDEAVFLTSETEDGAVCGERLVRLVEAELGCRARAVGIKGLQMRDGVRFRTVGIPALFEAIERETRDRAPDEIRFNATGGFKGTVPYLVLYAMFHGLAVSYVYEFSSTLITLPALAVEFAWERIVPAEEAIFTLFAAGPIARDRWRDLMPADDEANRDRYDPLFEFEDDLVGLSAIGYLMKSRLEAAESEAEVLLSASARAALAASADGVRAQFESMLSRVRNPLLRAGFKHAESLHKTDLKVWKSQGQQRMLYWTAAGRVFVGELFASHDAYVRHVDANPQRRRDYDLDSFARHEGQAGPDYEALLRDIEASRFEPAERIRVLEDELRDARIEIQLLRARDRAEAKRQREHAELRGYAQGRKEAEARSREQLDLAEQEKQAMAEAFRAQLREREDEIERLEAHIARLEGKLTSAAGPRSADA